MVYVYKPKSSIYRLSFLLSLSFIFPSLHFILPLLRSPSQPFHSLCILSRLLPFRTFKLGVLDLSLVL